LCIISIMAVLAIPKLNSLWSNLRLNTAARDLVSNFQMTKLEAVKRNVLCTVTFNLSINGKSYDYVVYVDDDQDLEYDAGETVIKSVEFSHYKSGVALDTSQGGSDGVSFANNDNSRPSIGFSSRGLPVDNGFGSGSGSVWIKNDRNTQKQVTISTTGMIKLN